jgi:hypothetical protein
MFGTAINWMLEWSKRTAWIAALVALALFYGNEIRKSPEYQQQPKQQQQADDTTDHKTSKVSTEERLAECTWWLAILTGVLAFSTLGLWVVSWRSGVRQSRDMLASLGEAKRSADLAERDLTATQRAFVYLEHLDMSVIRDRSETAILCKVVPFWANSGNTPTKNLVIKTNWSPSDGDLPRDFSYPYSRPPTSLFLEPRAKSGSTPMDIPIAHIHAATEDRARLYVWGRADYKVVFDRPHFAQFCFRVDVSAGGADGGLWFGFAHYGEHNRSDEDD